MPLERRMSRDNFLPDEVVELKQVCFTPGRVFQPGKYIAGELPDTAFTMGLVEQLPPVRGQSAEIKDPPAQPLDPPPSRSGPSPRIEFGEPEQPSSDEDDGIYV